MAVTDIRLYQTRVRNGIVQGDSTPLSFSIDDENDDGAIDRRDWSAFTGQPFRLTEDQTVPPMLFSAQTGRTDTGTLYAQDAYRDGQDIRQMLSGLHSARSSPRISDLNICFLAGTMIATPQGEVPVETLRPGDPVLTRDHGPQRLIWTHATPVTQADLDLAPNKRPVRIGASALGAGLPRRDTDVSPQHRVVVTDAGGAEYLISARHLMMAGTPGVTLRPPGGDFRLVHIAFATHEIVLAEGAPMESFYTGRMAVRALSVPQRLGLIACFPQIAYGSNPMTPARPFIKHRDYARMRAEMALG